MNTSRILFVATAFALGTNDRAVVPAGAAAEPAGVTLAELPGYHDLESRYTNREMSAREFQRAVERLERHTSLAQRPTLSPATAAPATATVTTPANGTSPSASPAVSPSAPQPVAPAVPAAQPAAAVPAPAPAPTATPAQVAVELKPSPPPSPPPLETKLPEPSPAKAPIAPAAPVVPAAPAAPAASVPSPKLSKRDRLNALLKLVVDGKMTDEEYKKRRAAIAAEPD